VTCVTALILLTVFANNTSLNLIIKSWSYSQETVSIKKTPSTLTTRRGLLIYKKRSSYLSGENQPAGFGTALLLSPLPRHLRASPSVSLDKKI